MANGLGDIEASIAAGPGGAEAGDVRTPIGVPKGFAAIQRLAGPPSPQAGFPVRPMPPQYFEGDQYTPNTWSVEETARLQAALDMAGLYDPEASYQLGYWDPDESPKAYKRLLSVANRSGTDVGTALEQAAAAQARSKAQGAAAKRRQPSVTVEVTSPDDLRVLADRVATKSIGKKLNPDQLDKFVQAYQGIEQQDAQQRIAAQGRGGSTVLTGAPSAETFFESQLDPKETFAHKYVSKFETFHNMLGGLGIQAAQPGEGGGTTGI